MNYGKFLKKNNILKDEYLQKLSFPEIHSFSIETKNLINNIYTSKIIHSIATLEYFSLLNNNIKKNSSLSEDLYLAIVIFELTQVDIPDSLGEMEVLRSYSELIKFYSALKNNFLYNQHNEYFERRLLKKSVILREMIIYLNQLQTLFSDITKGYLTKSSLLSIIDTRVEEYYSFIILDHVKTPSDKIKISNDLKILLNNNPYLKNNIDKEFSLFNSMFFLQTSRGDSISFLLLLFLMLSYSSLCNTNFYYNLLFCFRGIGILNVLLDDMVDEQEDKDQNDYNLFTDLLNGTFDYLLKNVNTIEFDRFDLFLRKLIQLIKNDYQYIFSKNEFTPALLIDSEVIIYKMLSLYNYMYIEQNNKNSKTEQILKKYLLQEDGRFKQ